MIRLLVDGNNLLHRIANLPNFIFMKNSKGEGTGIVYGFVRNVLFLPSAWNKNITVIWDGINGKKWRQAIYPSYKSNRVYIKSKVPEEIVKDGELKRQRPMIEDILVYLGIDQKISDNHEADDLIANAVYNNWNEEEIVIITEDRDMLQLVSNKVTVHQPIRKRTITAENFTEIVEHKNPRSYLCARLLWGDDSDNIAGFKGVAEKTAKAVVNEYGSIDRLLNDYERAQIKFGRLPDSKREAMEVLFRNSLLMDLRNLTDKIPDIRQMKATEGELNKGAVRQIFKHLEFDSLAGAVDKWFG